MTVEEFQGNLEEFIGLFHESTGLKDAVAVRKLIAVEVTRGTRYGVIHDNGEVVGMVGVYVDAVPGVRELEPAQIIDFAVREDFRGKGLGRVLMDWAADLARGEGEDALWLYTGSDGEIKSIYEKLGYSEAGRNPGFWQGKWDRVWFRRPL